MSEGTMNRDELAQRLANEVGLTKSDAVIAVTAIFDEIGNHMAEGKTVSIANFGKFEPRATSPRRARNPKTGATIQVPARTNPAFKAGKALKDKVDKQT